MSSKLRSVTVKLTAEMYAQIKIISDKRGATLSETLRDLVLKGLDEKIYKENVDLLTRVLREEMQRTMDAYFGCQPVARKQTELAGLRPVDPRRLTLHRRAG
jgi:hypothetical protein